MSDRDEISGTVNVAALSVRERDESPGALVRPAADLAQIEAAFADYQALCARLLDDDDYQELHQGGQVRRFPKRSAWRKLAVAFGVSFEIVERSFQRDEQGRVVSAEFIVRASAPNGRYADGWGQASVYERCCGKQCSRRHQHCPPGCDGRRHFTHPEHDIPATAETRAKNRAASDLFGMGSVSAEEVVDGVVVVEQPPAVAAAVAAPTVEAEPPKATEKLVTAAQRRLLFARAKDKQLSEEELRSLVYEVTGETSTERIPQSQLGELLSRIEALEK